MSAIFYESAFAEIKDKMKSTIYGRFCLDAYAAIARLSFLLRFAAWLLLFVGIVADFLLLAASPVIMVCMSQPGFDINHPGEIYTLALSTLTYGADLLVPAGLFMVLDKFWQKKPYWGVGLGVFWLILTILTFRAFAAPMHVAQFTATDLAQLLYYRTIDSLIYSSLSLVSVRFTMGKKEEPKLSPAQEKSIVNLEQKVNDLTTIIHNQQTINYQKIASELMPLLPRETGIKPEQITALEDRLLCQITHVISLINSTQIRPEIEEEKEEEFIPEKEPENNTGILDQITPENKPEIEEENNAPIPEKKEDELSAIWEEVIAKYPDVIEWRSSGLRSVSIQQIIEVTGYTSQKITRAINAEKLEQRKSGKIGIKNALIWLKKEPAITRKKEPAITGEKEPAITGENMPENSAEIPQENTPQIETELPHELSEKNTGELDNIPPSNSGRITRQLSMDDLPEEEKNTDPEIVAIEVEKGATNHE